jgi:hypothetical protein
MIFQEKFNKDFPSFFVVHKSECIKIESWELNGRFLSESAIAKRCIDKQRVKEAIDKVFDLDDEEDKVHNMMIKKELGLE